jgi:hypothetical protein
MELGIALKCRTQIPDGSGLPLGVMPSWRYSERRRLAQSENKASAWLSLGGPCKTFCSTKSPVPGQALVCMRSAAKFRSYGVRRSDTSGPSRDQ